MLSLNAALTALDWAIVAGYGVLVVAIAWWAKRRQRTSDDYLLAGRRLPWWVIAASLLASSFSSISLLSMTGWGWAGGLKWWQLWIGELLAVVVVITVFIPFYARQRVTTAYEFLEARFGRPTRWLAAVLFLVVFLARGGLFLLLAAKALAVFTPLGLYECIFLVGVAALVYSSLGGLGAVAWTDLLQLGLIVVGIGASFVLVVQDLPNGLASVLEANSAAVGRPPFSLSTSLAEWPSVLSGAIAYGVIVLFVAGTNQQQVQRYVACKDVASARRAISLAWLLGAIVGIVTVTLGAAIFARYGADFVSNSDDAFTHFVRLRVPAGLAGLIVAAVFAAAMSSIDSAIHSLSTATLVDLIEPMRREPLSDPARLRLARWLTGAFGLLAVGAALLAAQGTGDVLTTLINWLKRFAGPVLGLFLIGILTTRPRQAHVWLGMGLGLATAIALDFPIFPPGSGGEGWRRGRELLGIHGIWTAACALTVTVLTSVLASLTSHNPRPS